jgi:hypothetical protein
VEEEDQNPHFYDLVVTPDGEEALNLFRFEEEF